MRVKLVYTAPISISDSLDEPINDKKVLDALAELSYLDEKVLDYLESDIPDSEKFKGGYLRLIKKGKQLRLGIEIESARKLKRPEIAELRELLDGDIADGIGEAAFDFVETDASVSIQTFPDTLDAKSTLIQSEGQAWKPKTLKTERAANRRRCKAVAVAMKAADEAEKKKAAKNRTKPSVRQLLKLIDKGFDYPRPKNIKQQVKEEIEKWDGDLSFIKSEQLPFQNYDYLALLRILLKAKLNPNLHDREGQSLLWLAIGDPKCVELLLDSGADVNIQNQITKATALMRAAWLGKLDSVRLLLKHGADPLLIDMVDKTALDHAKNCDSCAGFSLGIDKKTKAGIVRALKAAMKR
jgi:hypothetical protein